MNKLKAQLIKNMQAELDKLKEDLLNISSQEILSRAYEYAMKTEIIYADTMLSLIIIRLKHC